MIDGLAGLIDRLSRITGWRGGLLSAVIGLGIGLGQAPFGFVWLGFPAIGLVILLGYTSTNPRQAAWRGFAAGFGFALLVFSWIVEPFLVDVKTFGWMAPFALLFMAAGFAFFWCLAFWLARRLAGQGTLALALLIPVLWTGSELLRSYILTGFPWALTSYIWVDTPVYQWAAFVGPHGLTLATFLLAAGLAIALAKRSFAKVFVGAALLVSAVAGGAWLQAQPVPDTTNPQPVVRLIQPNANQKQKWDPEMIPVFYNRQLDLTAEPGDAPVDLVIWPEVAVPFLLNDPSASFWEISEAANGARVILGAQRLDGLRAFNSLAVLGQGGEITQTYDKNHLVPFGEYIPGNWLLGRIGLKAMTAKYGYGYSAGPGLRVLDLGDLGKVMPLICYEAIFPHEMRRVAERPDWMLLITNDAWFGEAAGPYQHLAQARARAVEFGLPMVRVANTGISAVIDARGQVVDSMPLGVSGRLDVKLPGTLPASIYWKTGDTPVVLLLIVLGFAALWLKRRYAIDPAGTPM